MVQYYIGTSGWHYDDWRGRFYPEKLPTAKWLEHYAGHFATVELNNSFYRLPSEKAFEGWRSAVPDGFIFAVKASRYITHIKRLQDVGEALENFARRARLLGRNLGPVLYQLPPGLHRDDGLLEAFLAGLPGGLRHAVEFRHESWLDKEVYQILRRYRAAFCVFDMPELTAPLVSTAGFAYIRFHGSDSLYSGSYDDEALAGWAGRIAALGAGLEAVYIYFNNGIAGYAVSNALTIRNYLEESRN